MIRKNVAQARDDGADLKEIKEYNVQSAVYECI